MNGQRRMRAMSLILKDESRIDIYAEIEMERHYQDRTWGGPEHDDIHNVRDWVAYIVNYLGKTVNRDASWGRNLEVARRYLIKVAALCVAAIESSDRKIK
jgi:hypothetical protein